MLYHLYVGKTRATIKPITYKDIIMMYGSMKRLKREGVIAIPYRYNC